MKCFLFIPFPFLALFCNFFYHHPNYNLPFPPRFLSHLVTQIFFFLSRFYIIAFKYANGLVDLKKNSIGG